MRCRLAKGVAAGSMRITDQGAKNVAVASYRAPVVIASELALEQVPQLLQLPGSCGMG